MNTKNLKLAIQKNGRLTEETLQFLRFAGLEFESYGQKLFAKCRNFSVDILYVRNGDIPDYITSGVVDIGIIGQNVLYEKRPKVKKLLNLRYGFCSLNVAVLKESNTLKLEDLRNKKIATSYPNSTKVFFKKNNIPVEIVKINGSVELAPTIGMCEAVVDLVSTGSTLALNDLKVIAKIYDSEAVLIANKKLFNPSVIPSEVASGDRVEKSNTWTNKRALLQKLITRFKAVLSAKSYKYVMMNAPEDVLAKIKKIIPGLKSPTISSLATEGWLSVQTVIKEDVFWETIEKLKQIGASGIIVLPIEKMII